jgi:hypothetical protein
VNARPANNNGAAPGASPFNAGINQDDTPAPTSRPLAAAGRGVAVITGTEAAAGAATATTFGSPKLALTAAAGNAAAGA